MDSIWIPTDSHGNFTTAAATTVHLNVHKAVWTSGVKVPKANNLTDSGGQGGDSQGEQAEFMWWLTIGM